MNIKRLTKPWRHIAMIHMALGHLAHAGETTITTSDNAPSYNKQTEVVTGHNVLVALDTKCTIGNGTVNNIYTPSSAGITMYPDFPTGENSTEEKALFLFDNTTIGRVNTIKVHVTHDDNYPDGSPCLPKGQDFTFVVCLPAVSVAVTGTIANISSLYFFEDNVTIEGIDDPTQIEFQQLITATSINTTPTGAAYQSGVGAPYNCYNQIDWPWKVRPNPNPDEQHWGPFSGLPIKIEGNIYSYGLLAYTKNDFTVEVSRLNDTTNPICSFTWGYQWDNYNSLWTGSTPSEPAGLGTVVLQGQGTTVTPGEFYGIYGISKLK
jgi:hypothetical protein